MDYEYLQHIMGSPYVNEGAFDRLKARGAQAMQGGAAMLGHDVIDPKVTQIRSLWEGFSKSVNKILKDWNSQIRPMLARAGGLQGQAKRVYDAINFLYDNTAPNKLAGNYLNVRNKDDKSNITTLAREGMWDAANRDLRLNAALASNNPNTILEAYRKRIMSLWEGFLKDATRMTRMTKDQVVRLLRSIGPNKPGWQASGNISTIVTMMKELENVALPPVIPQQPGAAAPAASPAPSAVPPVIPPPVIPPEQPKPEQPKPEQPKPEEKPKETPPEQPKQAQQPQGGAAPEGAGEGEFQIPPSDLPYVILHALKTIVSATEADYKHAMGLFGKDKYGNDIPVPQLATKWGSGPYVTQGGDPSAKSKPPVSEIHSDPKSNKPTTPSPAAAVGAIDYDAAKKKKEDEDIWYKEFPGEFLYNFHSRFSKYPGKPFAIDVTSPNIGPEVPELPGVSIKVTWMTEQHMNQVYVTEIRNGKQSEPLLILQYFDNEVNPKGGATDPKSSNFFSIEKAVQASNPHSQNKLAGAPQQVMGEIKKLQDKVLRSLLAVSQRKNMEFTSQGWAEKKAKEAEEKKAGKEVPTSQVNNDGSVDYTDSATGQPVHVTQDQLKSLLKGPIPQAYSWRKRLEAVGYFEMFPDIMPVKADETQIWKDAAASLASLGEKLPQANAKLVKVWSFVKDKKPDASIWPEDANVTVEDLVKIALGKKDIPSTAKPTPATAAAASPPATPPPTAPASAPAPTTPVGGPAPTAPVSAPVSAPAGGPPPTAPVSNAPAPQGGQPAAGKPKGGKPKQPIKIWKTEDGTMAWSNFKGDNGALNSKTLAKLKAKYPKELKAALDQAKASGFKDPMKKEPEKGGEKPEQGGKQPLKELLELGDEVDLSNARVNPYQAVNFL